MGEMADYMLNGDDCECCGEYIGPGPGHPRRCGGCEEMSRPAPLAGDGKKHACPDCGKRFRKEIAVADHRRAVHAASIGRTAGMEFPWTDCKVAYGIDDPEAFEAWMERTNDGKGLLPAGWSLCETDASGARMVAIFRVEVELTIADGRRVEALLAAEAGGYPAAA